MLKQPVDRFSFHRPPTVMLRDELEIPGLINLYAKKFFTYTETAEKAVNLDVKYVSDSRHRWNFGYPSAKLFHQFRKVHLLTHPYSWTEEGYDNRNNFDSMVEEKMKILLQTFNSECKHFAGVKDELNIRKSCKREEC